jgi:Trk K+ transport system NAD-binding subunit/Kef-type K+ transport system membrane component KefB
MHETIALFASFIVLAIASREIGHFLGKYNLPHITGYLFTGMVVGPFILNLMPKGTTEELIIIDQLSLAVIAFIAGSELFLKELRSRLRSILMNTSGVVIAGIIINSIAFFLLTEFIPFTQGLSVAGRVAVAVLGSTILLALSPASTIAVLQEVRARGPFSKTILSMTVVMDVAVIILFAVVAALAATLLEPDATLNPSFILQLVIDLGLAVIGGVALGQVIAWVIGTSLHKFIKIAVMLILGTSVFVASAEVTALTKSLGFEVHLEALLFCMIAGFYITNFTKHRSEFEHLLHDVSPMIYVAFFTLTGIGLKLDILLGTIGIALALFSIRIVSIMIGSFAGGYIAGEDKTIRRYGWMGLITQAGIALGLAREVASEFPSLGSEFSTMIVSVVVLNEIFGPLFLKHVLRRVNESHEPNDTEPDMQRDVVIFGVEGQSITLSRQLQMQGWNVTLADTTEYQTSHGEDTSVSYHLVNGNNLESIKAHLNAQVDSIVAMLDDDDLNFEVCQLAYEDFNIRRLVVRLNDITNASRFEPFKAIVVDTTSAMVNLMDQAVRAPQSTALMMHQDPEYDIIQITVTDEELNGLLLRDLRLPPDVLVLEINRDNSHIVPHGNTILRCRDEMTLIGKPDSLEQVTIKLGY